jgi:hypothetical protein
MEIRADKWADDSNVASEIHTLSMRMYFHAELLLLLEAAGFVVTAADGDHQREPATADSEFLVYTAERRELAQVTVPNAGPAERRSAAADIGVADPTAGRATVTS